MKLALVGNQNSGKSTLFNTLTGANQKIGNWPGVTIEKKTGIIKNTDFELVDLPGIYSLNPYTKEEEITSEYIYKESVDILINIVDCNSIDRGLYLTTQLLDLNKNIIVVLNMHDIAEKKGIFVNEEKLSQNLRGIPVLKVSAATGEGCSNLKKIIKKIALKDDFNMQTNNFNIHKNKDYKKYYDEQKIENRYKLIDFLISQSVRKNKIKKETLTDKLDKIFLNKFLSIPIFIIIMLIIYYFSIDIIGSQTMEVINKNIELFSNMLSKVLNKFNASPILISLITDGIINGISVVMSFLPQLVFLFIAISFLEKTGYMSRISLIFDNALKKIGLSGNALISFIIGTGCSVPGIMATKTIKNDKEKQITAALTPFIPCSAKLPIISLFSSYFFKKNVGLIAVSFYILSIIIIILSCILFKKINNKNKDNVHMSELPEYRFPKWNQLFKDAENKILDFIKRAGSIIMVSSIIIWMLLSFSVEMNNNKIAVKYGVEVEDSILANIGKSISWIFVPIIGENSWEATVSCIQGLIAKEQVISSIAIISKVGGGDTTESIFSNETPFKFFLPSSAYAYVCFNLFSAPCFGAIGAMKKVFGNTLRTVKVVIYQTVLAYAVSSLIYLIGNLLSF